MSQNELQPENKETFTVKLKKYIKNLFDFSHYDTKTLLYIILFIFLVVISVLLLYYMLFIDETFLFILVIDWFVNPIILLGFIGILLFLIVMALQGLIVPLPSEIVLLATGMIWGWFWGGILGIAGSMAAGMLCMYISRKGGRPLAEKFIGESALEMADDFIEKHGMVAILIARAVPFMAFDPISYVSGLVDMDTKTYAIGTFLGSIPRAFIYSFLGWMLIKHEPGEPIKLSDIPLADIEQYSRQFNQILIIILGVLVIIFILYFLISKRYEKNRMSGNYLNKVKQLMKENQRIKVYLVRKSILMQPESFKIILKDWSEKFNFNIEEDELIINKETLPQFNKALDEKFDEMLKIKKEKAKNKKIKQK